MLRARWEFVFGDKKDAFLARRINPQQALRLHFKFKRRDMIASTIFDEIVDFIASKSPKDVIDFKASAKSSERYEFLVHKEKVDGLSKIEKSELDNFEVIEHLIRRAKLKARLILAA